jgi:hypothetical protein
LIIFQSAMGAWAVPGCVVAMCQRRTNQHHLVKIARVAFAVGVWWCCSAAATAVASAAVSLTKAS